MKSMLFAAVAAVSLATPAMATQTVNYTATFPNDPTVGTSTTLNGSFDYDFTGGVVSVTNAVFNNGFANITSGGFLSIFPNTSGFNGFVTIGNPTEPHGTDAYQILIGFDSVNGVFTNTGITRNQAQYSTSDPAFASRIIPFTTGGIPANFSFTVSNTPAVPEPATWAMMLVGFGAIGFAMRRRRTPVLAHAA